MGHGGGEKYINSKQVEKLNGKSVVLLMGCSSGVLKENGEYDPLGISLSYIYSGW